MLDSSGQTARPLLSRELAIHGQAYQLSVYWVFARTTSNAITHTHGRLECYDDNDQRFIFILVTTLTDLYRA